MLQMSNNNIEPVISFVEQADQKIGYKGIGIRFIFEKVRPEDRVFLIQKAFSEREHFVNLLHPTKRVSFPKIFSLEDFPLVAKMYYDTVRRL